MSWAIDILCTVISQRFVLIIPRGSEEKFKSYLKSKIRRSLCKDNFKNKFGFVLLVSKSNFLRNQVFSNKITFIFFYQKFQQNRLLISRAETTIDQFTEKPWRIQGRSSVKFQLYHIKIQSIFMSNNHYSGLDLSVNSSELCEKSRTIGPSPIQNFYYCLC